MRDTFFIQTNPDVLLEHTHLFRTSKVHGEKRLLQLKPFLLGEFTETKLSKNCCIFHQVEGLYIDENVSFADLKQMLMYFSKKMFGEETKIRFRPSYFPFTEPSAFELDIFWGIENESDYKITKGTGWLEILGCGMVDQNVLENCGIDSKKYSGYVLEWG